MPEGIIGTLQSAKTRGKEELESHQTAIHLSHSQGKAVALMEFGTKLDLNLDERGMA